MNRGEAWIQGSSTLIELIGGHETARSMSFFLIVNRDY